MKTIKLLSCALFILLGAQAKSQILSGLLSNTFEEITVNKRAVFSGEVQLNQGLWLNGRAQLSDGLTSIGGMDVSGDIVFNSLSLVTDLSENALVVVDPQGNIRRLSGFDALQSIIENRAIDFQQEISMPELSVLQNLKLFGAVELGEDVLFSGDAAFADDVRIGQSLNVTEEIRTATAIVENLEVNESIRTAGLVAEGVIESAGLSTEGIIKAAAVEADRVDVENTLRIGAMALDTALGTTAFVTTSTTGELLRMGEEQLAVALGPVFSPRPTQCLTNPGGEVEAAVPQWNYDVNKIVIDDCSRGTANVGLGTLDPTAKLDVIGTVKSRGLEVERGNALIRGSGNFDATDDEATVFLGDTEHGITAKRGFGLALSTFQNSNTLVLSEITGGVGIGLGMNAPQAKLHVESNGSMAPVLIKHEGIERFKVAANGNTYANEIYVQLDEFPDYVFSKEYKRLSLAETEAYIKQFGRLPKMPSAEEVEEEGANVGALVKLLVEKVEELTLDVIALNKTNEALLKKNQELENRMKGLKH